MSIAKSSPRVVIFAGPNGAGKSTHADAVLATLGIQIFVNADYIARGLSGQHTETVAFEAGRIMLSRLRQLADAGADFAFESTLASRTFVLFLNGLKARGYRVAIYYFSLSSAALAVRRVKLRVAMGGHHVSPDVVRRRFGRSMANFFDLYAPIADRWAVYDNSASPTATMVAGFDGNAVSIKMPQTWHKLQKMLKVR